MVMPYLSQVSITWSSRTEPPVCAMYATPLLCARSILSPNGKKASDPNDTPFMVSSHARFSSRVSTFGFFVKNCCQMPSAKTSSWSSRIHQFSGCFQQLATGQGIERSYRTARSSLFQACQPGRSCSRNRVE